MIYQIIGVAMSFTKKVKTVRCKIENIFALLNKEFSSLIILQLCYVESKPVMVILLSVIKERKHSHKREKKIHCLLRTRYLMYNVCSDVFVLGAS